MAHYLLSVHSVEGEQREPMSDGQMEEQMRKIGELEGEMKSAGAFVFSARLEGPETATVVKSAGGEALTTDGPFAETKEHMAGFYIVEADDLDAGLEWGTKTSECIGEPIEVRPFGGIATA